MYKSHHYVTLVKLLRGLGTAGEVYIASSVSGDFGGGKQKIHHVDEDSWLRRSLHHGTPLCCLVALWREEAEDADDDDDDDDGRLLLW